MSQRFVPWVRRAAIGDGLTLRIGGTPVTVELHHYGPGDVIGIDAAEIVTRVPGPDAIDVAPNLFPFVELRSADLPWRMTGGATPWLALVTVEVTADPPVVTGPGPLPVIELDAAKLPPIAEVALWAHAQVDGAATSLDGAIARVISPRRLAPNTRYVACLVPTCEAARQAGLGQAPPDPRSTAPAWSSSGPVVLPVYAHWYFTTAPRGDFENLVRRLTPRRLTASDNPTTVDYTDVDAAASATPLHAALVPVGHVEPPAPAAARDLLAAWLGAAVPTGEPRFGISLWGGAAAGATALADGWLADVNLDPRRRAAAALGAEVVRRHQDALVAEAWRQLGDVRQANRERDAAHLGALVMTRWTAKHVAPLAPAEALLVAAPALGRLRGPAGPLAREVTASALPDVLMAPGLRRLAATHARTTTPTIARAIATNSARRVPMGDEPTAVAAITTGRAWAALLAALVEEERPERPPRPRGENTGPGRSERPARTDPLGLSPTAAARRSVVEEALPILRGRAVPSREVTRPPALALARAAGDAVAALTEARAPARQRGRLDPGELTLTASPTAPLAVQLEIAVPLADLVREIDARYLVASVAIPPDSVGALVPNAAFIEAVMLGANDELARELHWRGAAIDPRATPLRRFFDVRGRTTDVGLDVPPVVAWPHARRLGSLLTTRDVTVIVWRGEFVRRFADAVIYAARAVAGPSGRRPSEQVADRLEPMFRGMISDDTMFAGFARRTDELRAEGGRGWYVVVVERPAGLRFGLDDADTPAPLRTWNDLAWDHVATRGEYVDVAARTPVPAAAAGLAWGRDAAHMAGVTAQRPMRVAFHCADLLPEVA